MFDSFAGRVRLYESFRIGICSQDASHFSFRVVTSNFELLSLYFCSFTICKPNLASVVLRNTREEFLSLLGGVRKVGKDSGVSPADLVVGRHCLSRWCDVI